MQDRVDGFLVSLDHLEHTGRQTGFEEQLGKADGNGGVALGGLEDQRVTACQGGAGLPQRIIAGKLNGVMPATTPSGWRIEYTSMPPPALR